MIWATRFEEIVSTTQSSVHGGKSTARACELTPLNRVFMPVA